MRRAGAPSNTMTPSSTCTVHRRQGSGCPIRGEIDRIDAISDDDHRDVGRGGVRRRGGLAVEAHLALGTSVRHGDPPVRRETRHPSRSPSQRGPRATAWSAPRPAPQVHSAHRAPRPRRGTAQQPAGARSPRRARRPRPGRARARLRPRAARSRASPDRTWHSTRRRHSPVDIGGRRGARPRPPGTGKRADDRAGPHPCPQRVVPRPAVEQRCRRVAQGLLIGREVEVHGGAVYGHR